jgi:precorrin-8X/cobalt-precorrin-8 methylmutase
MQDVEHEDAGKANLIKKPFIHGFYERPMSGEAIEALSLETIEQEAPAHSFSPEEWQVVKRLIHTTADFDIAKQVKFSPDAIEAACSALRKGSPIFADSNMIRSGISLARLRQACPNFGSESIRCHVADEDVVAEARQTGLPRSIFAVRKEKESIHGGIALFGNAPLALLELDRMILEEGIRPAFVIAMPVGFVHVTESKEEFMSLGIPFVAVTGRRGGSPLAVAALHALCGLARDGGKT